MKPETLMRTYLEEVVAQGRLGLIEELSHPDMVDEANQAFGGPPGRAGLVAHVNGFRRNIGNLGITVERIVAGDSSVVAWWSFTGLHTGAWLGRPPTGKPIRGSVFSFFDLVDGRIRRYRLFLHAELPESVVLDTSLPHCGLTKSALATALTPP
jgi:predicted ester cyclase